MIGNEQKGHHQSCHVLTTPQHKKTLPTKIRIQTPVTTPGWLVGKVTHTFSVVHRAIAVGSSVSRVKTQNDFEVKETVWFWQIVWIPYRFLHLTVAILCERVFLFDYITSTEEHSKMSELNSTTDLYEIDPFPRLHMLLFSESKASFVKPFKAFSPYA